MLPVPNPILSDAEIIDMVDALEKRAAMARLAGWGSKLTGLVGSAAAKAKSFIPGATSKGPPTLPKWTPPNMGNTRGSWNIPAAASTAARAAAPTGGFLGRNMGKIMVGTMLGNMGIQTADQLFSFSNPIKARQEGAISALNSIADLPWYQRMGFAAAPEAALKYRLSTQPTGWLDSFKKKFEDPVTASAINHLRAPGTSAPYHGVSQFLGGQQAGLTNNIASLATENEKLRALLARQQQ